MKLSLIIFAVLAVIAGLVMSLIWPRALETKKVFVSANQTIADVLKNDFKEQGFLVGVANIFKTNETVKEGWYNLIGNKFSIITLWNYFSRQQAPQEIEVRLIEGKSSAEYFKILETAGIANASELQSVWKNSPAEWSAKYEILKGWPKGIGLEGLLAPDTYRFYAKAKPADVIEKLVAQSEKNWQSLNVKNTSILEIYTLASIVEAEAATAEDRRLVAGIFWDRLKYNIALQADSTVNFITGKNTPNVSTADTKINSLYNTYKYKGLPPGPINNPSQDALQAAARPSASPYLYFFSTKDGTIIYSRTFVEHQANRVKYGI